MFRILKSVLVFSLYVISVDGNLALINAFAELQTQLNHRIDLLNERIDQIEQQVHSNIKENDGSKMVSQTDKTYVHGLVKAFNSEKTFIRKTLDLYQNGVDTLRQETTERCEKKFRRFRKEITDDNKTFQIKMSEQVMRLNATVEQYKSLLCDPSCEHNGGTCVNPGQCGKCPAGRYGENCEHKVNCTLPTERFAKDNTRTIFLIGEMISANMVKCRHGTPSPGTMTCRADGSWNGEITCIRNKIKYSVRLQVSASTLVNKYSAGTKDNVFLRIVGQNGQTDKFQLKGDFGGNKLVQMDYIETDVRPIHNVIASKDWGILIDDELSLVYVSIYIEDSEEYYVFTGRSLHTWLKSSQPLTLSISDHPESCTSHTYGEALNRRPRHRGNDNHVGMLTLLECKKRCVTSKSLKCKSVYYMPPSRGRGTGQCFLNEHSPDDDRYFRDNNSGETNRGDVSYKRICKIK